MCIESRRSFWVDVVTMSITQAAHSMSPQPWSRIVVRKSSKNQHWPSQQPSGHMCPVSGHVCPVSAAMFSLRPQQRVKLRSHEHSEANYLGRLEIIHFENIVGTRSSRRRISGVDLRGSTPGGGFGDTPYLNSLRIVVGTRSVLANPLRILQPCAVWYPR